MGVGSSLMLAFFTHCRYSGKIESGGMWKLPQHSCSMVELGVPAPWTLCLCPSTLDSPAGSRKQRGSRTDQEPSCPLHRFLYKL